MMQPDALKMDEPLSLPAGPPTAQARGDPPAGGVAPPTRSVPVTSMKFSPQDPDFDRRVRASFARQQVMATLGIEISRLSPGEVELTIPFAAATPSSTASSTRGSS